MALVLRGGVKGECLSGAEVMGITWNLNQIGKLPYKHSNWSTLFYKHI
jgi:hypothetical protein